jgi:hypothetical protein
VGSGSREGKDLEITTGLIILARIVKPVHFASND